VGRLEALTAGAPNRTCVQSERKCTVNTGVASENRLEREFNSTEATCWTCVSLLQELRPRYFIVPFVLGKGGWWQRPGTLCPVWAREAASWQMGRPHSGFPLSTLVLSQRPSLGLLPHAGGEKDVQAWT